MNREVHWASVGHVGPASAHRSEGSERGRFVCFDVFLFVSRILLIVGPQMKDLEKHIASLGGRMDVAHLSGRLVRGDVPIAGPSDVGNAMFWVGLKSNLPRKQRLSGATRMEAIRISGGWRGLQAFLF